MAGVLILGEVVGGQLAPTTLQLATVGRGLADERGSELVAVLAGRGVRDVAASLGEYGVDRVFVAEPTNDGPVPSEWVLSAAEQAARATSPDVILIAHSLAGREVGPLLAFRLETGIVTDAVRLKTEGDRVRFTKPVFGGSALTDQIVRTSPQIATLRSGSFDAAEPQAGRTAQTEAISVGALSGGVEALEDVREAAGAGPRLKDAKIVVAGGRGLGDAANWHHLEELAATLGAAVGATRAVTDAGWVSPSLQVGLTGATIAPDLYITVGISGAVQHIAGITGARVVVAINKDPEANIFKHAHYGIVDDWSEVLPAFAQRLKELRG